ncbi:unnamed protein product [Cuscuta campestris]|uniref:Uncharacterized protein n=1 Tax=Cuscuta campestris TaxID=132261 RepID=A0A484NII1_9ASTE|nr:unnamed protein product [Cuscuta campestris]
MAGGKTKTKATMSKKKSTADASSSLPETYPYLDGSFLEFGSEAELHHFLSYFNTRPIAPPRILPELYPQQKGFHGLDNQLQASGLWPFVSKSHQSFNHGLVRVFYSNLRREGDVLKTSINLYEIEIKLDTLSRVSGLPTRGEDIATYGGEDWYVNNEGVVLRELGITNLIRHKGAPTIHSAPLEKRVLLYLLTRVLHPRDHSHTTLFTEDVKMIHAIMHGADVNWAKFIMINMPDCASISTERSLPYAFLVMEIIARNNIHIAGPVTKMTKLWLINDGTFRKKSENRNGAGTSRVTTAAPARASLQSIADSLNALTVNIDDMGRAVERIDRTVQRQRHDMRAYFKQVQYVPPPYDGTFLGQDYDGGDEDDDSYAPSSSPDEDEFDEEVDGDAMDVEDDENDDEDS